ncbi:cell growth-regulating nucleolar protein [Stigmatopora argus]
MVFFTCNSCGESIKKAQVEQHVFKCWGRQILLSCIDCGKEFRGEDYKNHVQCISEAEKYGGKDYQAKSNKLHAKQDEWIQKISEARNNPGVSEELKYVLRQISTFNNVPRKKRKFEAWISNSWLHIKDPRLVGEVWTILNSASEIPASAPLAKNKTPTIPNEINRENKKQNEHSNMKQNKLKKQEAPQQANGKVHSKSKKTEMPIVEEESVTKKKKKEKKRSRGCEETGNENHEQVPSKKIKTDQTEEATLSEQKHKVPSIQKEMNSDNKKQNGHSNKKQKKLKKEEACQQANGKVHSKSKKTEMPIVEEEPVAKKKKKEKKRSHGCEETGNENHEQVPSKKIKTDQTEETTLSEQKNKVPSIPNEMNSDNKKQNGHSDKKQTKLKKQEAPQQANGKVHSKSKKTEMPIVEEEPVAEKKKKEKKRSHGCEETGNENHEQVPSKEIKSDQTEEATLSKQENKVPSIPNEMNSDNKKQNGHSDKKQTKLKKQEAPQQENGKVHSKSKKTEMPIVEEEPVAEKKKKEKKRSHGCEETGNENHEQVPSKEIKSDQTEETTLSEHSDLLADSKGTFKWKETIKAVLRSSPKQELRVKKLEKKVIAAYFSTTGDGNFKTKEEALALFSKKVNNNPKFKVLEDRVSLVI